MVLWVDLIFGFMKEYLLFVFRFCLNFCYLRSGVFFWVAVEEIGK